MTHFNHFKIIEYTGRPFSSTDEMNEVLIKNWNSVVKKTDRIFHLGDVGFFGKTVAKELLLRLNGTKILIKGNHDNHSNQWFIDVGFDTVYNHSILLHHKYILTHFPLEDVNDMGEFVNVHGHIHERVIDNPCFFNVSVEQLNYTPLDFNVIRKQFEG